MNVSSALPYSHLLWVSRDKEGVEHHVVVVKATFDIQPKGYEAIPAAGQLPVALADLYHGEPGKSSLREAHDMARHKPLVDFVVCGSARSYEREPVTELPVQVAVEGQCRKAFRVVGDRRWERSLAGKIAPSDPEPFVELPIVFERAYGGAYTADDPTQNSFHRENLCGVGCYGALDPRNFLGTLAPNLEPLSDSIRSWGDAVPTCGFSFVSPASIPRIGFAGTYDDNWLAERFPLLPEDFDDRFEQTAPPDQQLRGISAGDLVAISNMSHHGPIRFRLPPLELPITFMVKGERDVRVNAHPDTLVVRADERQFTLIWRASIPCRSKFHALRKVVVGDRSERWFRLQRGAKPYYEGLDELVRAERQRIK